MNSNDKYHYRVNGLGRTYCREGIYPTTKIKEPDEKDNGDLVCVECMREFDTFLTIVEVAEKLQKYTKPRLKWWERLLSLFGIKKLNL